MSEDAAIADTTGTEVAIREALWAVEDPELRMSILELGLVYDVAVEEDGSARVTMTLTSPACPVGPMLESMVKRAAEQVSGVERATVEITFEPPWDPRVMASDDVKLTLGIW